MARGKEEGMARLSTLTHGQINIQGRYIFILPSLLKFEKKRYGHGNRNINKGKCRVL